MKPRPGIVSALFHKHANRVRRTLGYRLRNEEDGKDAAQETFLRLWRQERQGTLRADAVAYLNAAAGTMAFEFHRRRVAYAIDREEALEADDLPSATPGLDDSLHWRGALTAFVAGVESLPEQMRDVFLLHHLKGLTYPQIAAKLGISLRTTERHMEQALLRLHRCVKDYL